MGLIEQWEQHHRAPTLEVKLGRTRIRPSEVTVNLSLDAVNATASLMFPYYPEGVAGLESPVTVDMGWDGYRARVFTGTTTVSDQRYAPYQYPIQAVGPLKRAQARHRAAVPYLDVTDGAIVTDLLARCGLTAVSIDEAGMALASAQPIWLQEGQAPWDIIAEVDRVTGYRTFDGPDGMIRRRRVTGYPGESAAFTLAQGTHLLEPLRHRTVEGLHNMVLVEGLAQGAFIPKALRGDPDPDDGGLPPRGWVPDPPRYIVYTFQSDYLETLAQCDAVALRLMLEKNHITEEMSLRVKGNPYLVPGVTVGIVTEKLGLPSVTNYLITHSTHVSGSGGYWTTLRLRGGVGAPGEAGDPYDDGSDSGGGGGDPVPLPSPLPEPSMEWVLTSESFVAQDGETVTGTRDLNWYEERFNDVHLPADPNYINSVEYTTLYTFSGIAASSYSPEALPSTLTYAWANSANADTSAIAEYSTAFTAAQLEAGVTVSLTVTDASGNARTITQPVTADDAEARIIFGYSSTIAVASLDGGATWKEVEVSGRVPDGAALTEYVALSKQSVQDGTRTRYYIPEWEPIASGQAVTFKALAENGFHKLRVHFPVGTGVPWVDQDGVGGAANIVARHICHLSDDGTEWESEYSWDVAAWLASEDDAAGFTMSSIYSGCCQAAANASQPCKYQHNIKNCAYVVDLYKQIAAFVPDNSITAMPEIAGVDWTLYGTAIGVLYWMGRSQYSEDWDLSTMAGSETDDVLGPGQIVVDLLEVTGMDNEAITAIWVNEANQARTTIGTTFGNLYRGPSFPGYEDEWAAIPAPALDTVGREAITYIIESALTPGQYRIGMGGKVYITHDDFQSVQLLHGFDAPLVPVNQIALSPFGNLAVRPNPALGEVRDEAGTLITVPDAPFAQPASTNDAFGDNYQFEEEALVAVTAHIRNGGFWAISARGEVYWRDKDAAAFSALTTIPDARWERDDDIGVAWSGVRHAVRDGLNLGVLYTAGARGLIKSYDGGTTWRVLYRIPLVEGDQQWEVNVNGDAVEREPVAEMRENPLLGTGYGSAEWIV